MGKCTNDRDTGKLRDSDRDELKLQGQENGIWLQQARANFLEEVAYKLGLEK